MRRNLTILIACATVILIVMAVRGVAFAILYVPHDTQRPMLEAGDRVLVRKWAYGMRLPWWKDGRRTCRKTPLQGDWIAFEVKGTDTATRQQGIGCLMACPGDTVWLGPQLRVSPTRDYANGCIWPLAIPTAGAQVKIDPWNADLYARTINAYEPAKVTVKGDRLCIGGHTINHFRFTKNYYWIYSGNATNLHDSRSLGFLPAEAILGQATTLLYSIDPQAPWYRSLRTGRTFRPLGGKP